MKKTNLILSIIIALLASLISAVILCQNIITTATMEPKSNTNVKREIKININTATIDDLKSLQTISDDIAHKIIAYRQKIGGYTSVEQIMQIDGIGQITFNNISPFLTVGG